MNITPASAEAEPTTNERQGIVDGFGHGDNSAGSVLQTAAVVRRRIRSAPRGRRALKMPCDHFERSGLVFPVQDHGPPWASRWFCSQRPSSIGPFGRRDRPQRDRSRPVRPCLRSLGPLSLGAGFMNPAPTYVGAQSSNSAPRGGGDSAGAQHGRPLASCGATSAGAAQLDVRRRRTARRGSHGW